VKASLPLTEPFTTIEYVPEATVADMVRVVPEPDACATTVPSAATSCNVADAAFVSVTLTVTGPAPAASVNVCGVLVFADSAPLNVVVTVV
jgi:hypothetical protein